MSRFRILVVEDEGIVAADIQNRLQRLGYDISVADSGEKALEMAAHDSFDLALMDIVLKGRIDGVAAATELSRRFQIPAIFLSAYADDKTLERAKCAKPYGFVIKPFEEKGLHSMIELALEKHKMERTERKRIQQERELIELQLRQAQKLEALGRLAAGILHEVNVPTQFIRDNTRFLQRSFERLESLLSLYRDLFQAAKAQADPSQLLNAIAEAEQNTDAAYLAEEIPKAIRESLEGVERVVRIVQAMKEFSHPRTQSKSPMDLNRAIESTLLVARSEWKQVAEVTTDLDPSLPHVDCFASEINQAVLNLIVNAAQAIVEIVGDGSKGKGTITVATRRIEDCVEIRVSDTGNGIPEAVRERIFEPFFTTKEVGKGTGLGLAIVQTVVVKNHTGAVSFVTEPGKGTTFIVRLPIKGPPIEGA